MEHATQSSAKSSFDLWLGKAAPRYTSYPPAPFFHAGVTDQDYMWSLEKLHADQSFSAYIHIPFCQSLCLYCGCNTSVTQREDRVQQYLAAVKHEMTLVNALIKHAKMARLHFGGGTPNILSNKAMRGLFDHLHQTFDFGPEPEIAMELDPRVVSKEQVETLAACGVTRVSLGVQDFNPGVQAIIHRHQPYEMVARVCDWLRSAGINQINFDLVYGLPQQTAETIADTAAKVCALRPDRIALFSYAHVPQIKKHQKVLESYGLPDLHERLAMDQIARGQMISHGYQAIGIDHFATYEDSLTQAWKAGKLHRNFQGYTEDNSSTLISFGASSISQTDDGYFHNEREEGTYQTIVNSGRLPIRRGFLLSPEDKVRRAIIEQFMCTLSCDLEMICKAHDHPVEMFDDVLCALRPYEDAGLIARHGYAIALTTPYRMVARVICEAFDAYTSQAQMPVSRTA